MPAAPATQAQALARSHWQNVVLDEAHEDGDLMTAMLSSCLCGGTKNCDALECVMAFVHWENTCEGPIPRSGTLWLALWKNVFGTCGRL